MAAFSFLDVLDSGSLLAFPFSISRSKAFCCGVSFSTNASTCFFSVPVDIQSAGHGRFELEPVFRLASMKLAKQNLALFVVWLLTSPKQMKYLIYMYQKAGTIILLFDEYLRSLVHTCSRFMKEQIYL